MPICVECGKETPRDDMYGVGQDLRCPVCAGKRRTVYTQPRQRTLKVDGWVTWSLLVVAAALFMSRSVPLSTFIPGAEGTVQTRLASFPPAIWDGEIWRLITSCFLHGDFLHILFNGLALWRLGPVIEAAMGRWLYLGFVLLLGGASIGTEVAVHATTTIGLSGVVFGLFGYLYALRRTKDFAAAILTPQVVQSFVFMFFLCILLDASGSMAIGNWAHGSGAALGWLFGFASQHRLRITMIALTILVAISLITLPFYMPWNADFCLFRAYQSAQRGDEAGFSHWTERATKAPFPAKLFAPIEPRP
jgi:membrane associated rhomboid family serine protease